MTDRIKGITIEIGGDITGLSKALAGINKEMHAPCHHTAIQKGTQTPRGSSPVAVQCTADGILIHSLRRIR